MESPQEESRVTTEEVKVEGTAACAVGLLQNYCPATELVSLPPPPLAPLPPPPLQPASRRSSAGDDDGG